jgi:hypothetical protein
MRMNEERRTPASVVIGNLAWFGALTLSLFVIIKIAIISRFGAETSVALVASANIVSVAGAVLISLLSVLLVLAANTTLAAQMAWSRADLDLPILLSVIVIAVLIFFATDAITAALAYVLLLLCVVSLAVARVSRRPQHGKPLGRFSRFVVRRFMGKKTLQYTEEVEAMYARMADLRADLAKIKSEHVTYRNELNATEEQLADLSRVLKSTSPKGAINRLRHLAADRRLRAARQDVVAARRRIADTSTDRWLEENEKKLEGMALELESLRRATPSFLPVPEGRGRRLLLAAPMLYVLALLFFAISSSRPWVSPERITTSHAGVIIGYVIDPGGDWMTILAESDRTIVRVKSSRISRRELCSVRSSVPPRTLAMIVRKVDRPHYPKC